MDVDIGSALASTPPNVTRPIPSNYTSGSREDASRNESAGVAFADSREPSGDSIVPKGERGLVQTLDAGLQQQLRSATGGRSAGGPSPVRSNATWADSRDRKAEIDALISVVPAWDRRSAATTIAAIVDAAHARGVADPHQVAYIVATAEHESDLGTNMREIPRTRDGLAHQVEYFDGQYSSRTDIGNRPGTEDGYTYRGRGLVQITGRANYQKFSKEAGSDLVAHPENATDVDVAAKILVNGMMDGAFTGASLGEFVDAERRDYVDARTVVNGHDVAGDIAARAETYANALADVPRH